MVLVCFSSLIRLSCAMRKSDSKTHRIRHVPTHKTHHHKTKKQTNHPKPDQTESTDQQTDNSKLKPNQTEDKQNKKQNTTKQSKPNKNQASSNVNISDAYLNMHKHHLTHYTDHHWSSLIITDHHRAQLSLSHPWDQSASIRLCSSALNRVCVCLGQQRPEDNPQNDSIVLPCSTQHTLES